MSRSRRFSLDFFILLALAGFILVAPSNLFLKFFEPQAYVHGLFVDYLLPKLYLSDFLIAAVCGLVLVKKKKQLLKSIPLQLLGVAVLLGAAQAFALHQISAFWYVTKLLEWGVLVLCLSQLKLAFRHPFVITAGVISLTVQSFWGLLQFFTQHSITPFAVFGETNLHALGIATATWTGREYLLPYGTTSHPNVLAWTIVVLLVWLWSRRPKGALYQVMVGGSAVALFTLFLTQSLTAWLALGAAVLIPRIKSVSPSVMKKGLGFFFVLSPVIIETLAWIFPHNLSITRRALLNRSGLLLFLSHPLFGVGLNNFTAAVESVNRSPEVVRFVQPAHHIGVLWLSESGGVGLALIYLIWNQIKKIDVVPLTWLILVVVAGSFDHYILTNQIGMVMAIWSWATVRNTPLHTH